MERIKELDVSKGLAILLVVIGHVCAREIPEGNEWYMHLKNVIYSFHMPFFVFLAGVTSFRAFERIHSVESYFSFMKKKLTYFGRHFIFLSLLIFSGKLFTQQFIHIDNGVNKLSDFFIIFYNPLSSFSAFLWFIYTLVIFYAITPLLLCLFKRKILPIISIAVMMHYIETTPLFTLNRVFLLYVFYFSGYITGCYYKTIIGYVIKYGPLFLILFLSSLVFFQIYQFNISQFLSVPAILYIAYILKELNFFNTLGKNSYFIYLYNTICIGIVKGALFIIVPWQGPVFIFYFFALTIAGLVGPLCIQKLMQLACERLRPQREYA